MKTRATTSFLLTVLAFGAVAFFSGPMGNAVASDSRTAVHIPLAPEVTIFGTPVWETIPGTSVARIREQQRPDYDLFRYGSRYYIYNDGYWYRSDRLNRKFVVVDDRYVPMAFSRVPSNQWRSYPPGWMNPKNPHYSGRHDNRNHAVKPAGNDNHGNRAVKPADKSNHGKKGR